MTEEPQNPTKTLQSRHLLLWGLVTVCLLVVAVLWLANHHYGRLDGQLQTELRRKVTLTVADSVERRAAARYRAGLDSQRTHYENRLAAQRARYQQQKRRDQDLESRYRALGPLDLPAYE